jgi:hypothetical protein
MVTEAMLLSRDWERHQAPFFKVEEVAKVFFGMSASWLRLRMSADAEHPNSWFTYPDGRRIEFRRADPDKTDSARVFLLSDIEPMVDSLVKFGRINNARAVRIKEVVRAIAAVYNLFDAPGTAAEGPADEEPADEEPGEGEGAE